MSDDIAISFVLSRHDAAVFTMGFCVGWLLAWTSWIFAAGRGKGRDSSW
jgi:uncharacterized membrane protein YciS (DUF1049 family)